MIDAFDYLREFNIAAVTLRLVLAMLFGGMLGLERARKRRAAGFRTYMIVCIGATLAILLSQYEAAMLSGPWKDVADYVGIHSDVSRFGAQVINGIGFLGTGTIIVTGRQEVKGLTTAAGLWASACMGLAIGAGFYECVILAVLLITFCVRLLPIFEGFLVERARNINIYVEFASLDDVGAIISRIKEQGAQIFEVDINHGEENRSLKPSAVFSIRLNQRCLHEEVLTAISDLEHITMIDEV
jgi:putative Mg2+ transporter-C (MgtC) family protein